AVGADSHRAQADLHVSQNLALQPVHGNHGDGKTEEDKNDINEHPKHIASCTRSSVALEIRGDVVEHQRSTSPSTMSKVPMTAITSATSAPRTIMSRAWRFTNDGGRTRTR